MLAWYFSDRDKKLRYGDNRQIRAGRTHKVKFPYYHFGYTCPKPYCCYAGLHGSLCIMDALWYGAGYYVWRVNITGYIHKQHDKIAGAERTYLWGFDASSVIHKWHKSYEKVSHEERMTLDYTRRANARLTRMINVEAKRRNLIK